MGANQSANRPSTGPRAIPVRPRTPLRFGSVPTPMPVNPYEYNTRPVRNLHPHLQKDSITCILSQDSYFSAVSPTSSISSAPSSPTPSATDTTPSSFYSEPPSDPRPYKCKFSECAYSTLGYSTSSELAAHLADGVHFAPGGGGEPDVYGGGWVEPGVRSKRYPAQSQEQCACNFCCTPLHTLQQQTMMTYHQAVEQQIQMMLPQSKDLRIPPESMVSYSEDWQEYPRLQMGYGSQPPTKRARAYY